MSAIKVTGPAVARGELDFLPQTAEVALAEDFIDFLTLPAYDLIRD